MTQSQLEDAVACATGESARTVQARGFGPAGRRAALEPEDLALYAACPRCGSAAALPGPRHPDRLDFAACRRCGLAFDCRDEEVFAAVRAAV